MSRLNYSDSKSLLKKYLRKFVYNEIKDRTTVNGASLIDVIQSGVANLDSSIGVYAPDAESYSVFRPLFDPIIEDYHNGFDASDNHPQVDFGDVKDFKDLDPNKKYIISTRIRCARSIDGFPFNPMLTQEQYEKLETKTVDALEKLGGELKGTYYPLDNMSGQVKKQLTDDHFLFKEGDRFLEAANSNRFWPKGRGIYHNSDKTFLVWVNEEDHLRVISMQEGGDVGEVYGRLVNGLTKLDKLLKYRHDERLGYLTFCPTNLGTTVRASVHIKLPKLSKDYEKLEDLARLLNLQIRGTRGEHSDSEDGVYDISNTKRLGITEYQAVKQMYDGVAELIQTEKMA